MSRLKITHRADNIITVLGTDGREYTVDTAEVKYPVGTRLAFPAVGHNPQRVTRISREGRYHSQHYVGNEKDVSWAPEAGCETTEGTILAIRSVWALVDSEDGTTPRTVRILDLTPTGGYKSVVKAEGYTHQHGDVLGVYGVYAWVWNNGRPWVYPVWTCEGVFPSFPASSIAGGVLDLRSNIITLTLESGIVISGHFVRFTGLLSVAGDGKGFLLQYGHGVVQLPRKTEFTWSAGEIKFTWDSFREIK